MSIAKQRIKQAAARRRRSAFRAEFYKDADARRRPGASQPAAGGVHRRRVQRLPFWVSVGSLGVLFCLIAIGGSSAMIWLRRLGALFGVHWIGD